MSDPINIVRRRLLKGFGAGLIVAIALPYSRAEAATPGRRSSVIIIGAGMAGLGAARKLLQAGHSVTVLEARNRIAAAREQAADRLDFEGAGIVMRKQ